MVKASLRRRSGKAFPKPKRFGAYNIEIDDDATAIVQARQESAHKARRAERATFKTARRETTQFVLAVVTDTWFREIQYPYTIYTEVGPKDLFAHLQVGCTGRHALGLLVLHNEIQHYHIEVESIPEYIIMLEDAQRQAGRAGQTTTDDTLLLFVSKAMLTTERFPRANEIKRWLHGNYATSNPTPRRG